MTLMPAMASTEFIDADYSTPGCYDPAFLGIPLPLPVGTDGKPSVTAYLLSQDTLVDEFRPEHIPL